MGQEARDGNATRWARDERWGRGREGCETMFEWEAGTRGAGYRARRDWRRPCAASTPLDQPKTQREMRTRRETEIWRCPRATAKADMRERLWIGGNTPNVSLQITKRWASRGEAEQCWAVGAGDCETMRLRHKHGCGMQLPEHGFRLAVLVDLGVERVSKTALADVLPPQSTRSGNKGMFVNKGMNMGMRHKH